jgi:hypothetical protein
MGASGLMEELLAASVQFLLRPDTSRGKCGSLPIVSAVRKALYLQVSLIFPAFFCKKKSFAPARTVVFCIQISRWSRSAADAGEMASNVRTREFWSTGALVVVSHDLRAACGRGIRRADVLRRDRS